MLHFLLPLEFFSSEIGSVKHINMRHQSGNTCVTVQTLQYIANAVKKKKKSNMCFI